MSLKLRLHFQLRSNSLLILGPHAYTQTSLPSRCSLFSQDKSLDRPAPIIAYTLHGLIVGFFYLGQEGHGRLRAVSLHAKSSCSIRELQSTLDFVLTV